MAPQDADSRIFEPYRFYIITRSYHLEHGLPWRGQRLLPEQRARLDFWDKFIEKPLTDSSRVGN